MEIKPRQWWVYPLLGLYDEPRKTLYPGNSFITAAMKQNIEDKLKTIQVINEEIAYIEKKVEELVVLTIAKDCSIIIMRDSKKDHEFILPNQDVDKMIKEMQNKYLDRKAELFENAKLLMK